MTPITADEFAALMAPLEPFPPGRRIVAAVSGGADSMALALLLRQWGAPLAVVIDHALRAQSAAEAALTTQRLAEIGIPTRLISLAGSLPPGPGLGARARAARYAALLDVCRQEGLPDLVTGHHAHDQAETVSLRAAARSGPAGLAGMPARGWRADARLLRPLLAVPPERLRATLRAAGLDWVEDPTNHDRTTARGALRARPLPTGRLLHQAAEAARRRASGEAALAEELAQRVAIFPTGHAEILAPLSEPAWSALLWTLSGRPYPPPRDAVRRLAARAAGTLHGVRIHRGLALREAASIAPPLPAYARTLWDGRFLLHAAIPGAELGALGDDAARLRRRPGLPSGVLRTLPALRIGGKLLAVPHLAYLAARTCHTVSIEFRPARPLAGLPFCDA